MLLKVLTNLFVLSIQNDYAEQVKQTHCSAFSVSKSF